MKMFRYVLKLNLAQMGLLFAISILAVAASEPTTNAIPENLFLTDNGSLFWYRQSGERVVHISEIKKAEIAPESRPAEQDPMGHWGGATNGFQLGLRFEKVDRTNGEPIMAVAFMRNTSNTPQGYFSPIRIIAMKDGKQLKRKDENPLGVLDINVFPQTMIYPQTQHRYSENLSQIYDLTQKGEYIFQAVSRKPELVSEKVSVVVSRSTAGPR